MAKKLNPYLSKENLEQLIIVLSKKKNFLLYLQMYVYMYTHRQWLPVLFSHD